MTREDATVSRIRPMRKASIRRKGLGTIRNLAYAPIAGKGRERGHEL